MKTLLPICGSAAKRGNRNAGAHCPIALLPLARAHAAMSKAQKISGTPDAAQLVRAAERSARRTWDQRYDSRFQASKPVIIKP